LNILLLRDEKRINITSYADAKIVLNATNNVLIARHKDITYNVTIKLSNPVSHEYSYFNVTFVNSSNTEVRILKWKEASYLYNKIFYNCGDNNFEYNVGAIFDGPNFNIAM
jgi:hypothetical protein